MSGDATAVMLNKFYPNDMTDDNEISSNDSSSDENTNHSTSNIQ